MRPVMQRIKAKAVGKPVDWWWEHLNWMRRQDYRRSPAVARAVKHYWHRTVRYR